MAAAETRSSGGDTVNCRAREIRTDSIRLVASRKLQRSIIARAGTPVKPQFAPPVAARMIAHPALRVGRPERADGLRAKLGETLAPRLLCGRGTSSAGSGLSHAPRGSFAVQG